jgi:surfeit locus 1 family protein
MSMAARVRSLILPGLLTLVALAILVSLGNWQLDRLAWKEALIASATERPNAPVVDLPPAVGWPTLDIAANEYRPFRLSGRFLVDREALVFTNLGGPKGPHGGPGFWVVAPFELEAGGTVLVNRGFVPQDRRAPEHRAAPPAGPVTVTGLLRPDDRPNLFTPADRPAENMFFSRSIAAIASAKQLGGPVAPFGIDLLASETPPGGLPQAGETRMAFSNDHLGYAITWYGLAVALLGVFAGFAWTRLSGTSQQGA